MVFTWGGPDLQGNPTGPTNGSGPNGLPRAKLPGFNRFMMERFSPLSWALPMNPNFDPKDAQGRQVLGEAAGLQKAIYAKTGQEYLTWLRDMEMPRMGIGNDTINDYLGMLCNSDTKGFQQFFKVCNPRYS